MHQQTKKKQNKHKNQRLGHLARSSTLKQTIAPGQIYTYYNYKDLYTNINITQQQFTHGLTTV